MRGRLHVASPATHTGTERGHRREHRPAAAGTTAQFCSIEGWRRLVRGRMNDQVTPHA